MAFQSKKDGSRMFSSGLRGILLALATAVLANCAAASGVRGTVVDAQGQRLSGIEVRLYGPRDDGSGVRPRLSRGTSDGQGRFALDAPVGRAELLELRGADGSGRVRLGDTRTPVTVTYPVRTTVVLLHDNDLHFNFNHREVIGTALEGLRSQYDNVFLLNAGDIFIRRRERWNEPTEEFYARHSRRIIDLMNGYGYDAMTLGNHELYYIGGLTREALAAARFPLLAANVEITTEFLPQPLPYTVLVTDNDLTIAVLGLSVVNFEKEGVAMRDPLAVAEEYLHLAETHDLFVALTHIGHRTDQRLAEGVGTLDVIIGGHSHTLLEEAVLVNGVLVAQAGGTAADRPNPVDPERPKYLGKVTLTLENGRVVEKRGEVVAFTAQVPSAAPALAIP
jgi:2',3'-cyclic-nucleotide 2'-phosphodiesterase (5'-nucleotidase family)